MADEEEEEVAIVFWVLLLQLLGQLISFAHPPYLSTTPSQLWIV